MLERLSPDAGEAIAAAGGFARTMGAAEVRDDHLLIALAMRSDLAAEVVCRWASVEDLVAQVSSVEDAHGRAPEIDPEEDVVRSRHVDRVVEHAQFHSHRLAEARITTVALLLGIFEHKGPALDALRAVGVDVAAMERDVLLSVDPSTTVEFGGAWTLEPLGEGQIPPPLTGSAFAQPVEPAAPPPPAGSLRGWPSPRCQGCRQLVRDHARVWTMDVPDQATGETVRFRFLYCGSCGTAFAIENLDP